VTDFKINGKAYVERKEGGVLKENRVENARIGFKRSKRWLDNKVRFAKLTGKGGTATSLDQNDPK
jgi:hypothetical protein